MNGTAGRFFRLGVGLAGLVTVGWVLTGYAAKPVRHGVPLPTDWTHRHLIFSHPQSAEQAARVSEDPRYWQQVHRREQRLAMPAGAPDADVHNDGVDTVSVRVIRRIIRRIKGSKNIRRDWSKNLGAGASAGAGNYPAKFSFNTSTSFCNSDTTPDYAVFSTGLAGSLTQASVVAYDNLYFYCTGTTPLLYWAYDTGGQILTSPVLSLDGTQVAFMQTSAGVASLVILKWHKGDGTVGAPLTLVPLPNNLYPGCIAPCMTQVSITDSSSAPIDDTTSSAYYDYSNDVVWTGGAAGWLNKITGVFKGQPSQVTTGGFPVQVNTGSPTALSSPVYDRVANSVFLTDAGGFLYRVNATTAAVTQSGRLDFSNQTILSGPVVDTTASSVYVFASSDGAAGCNAGAPCSAVYQLSTAFVANGTGSKATVGNSLVTGSKPLFIGGFDSGFYNSSASTPTGNLYVCGNTGANATLYQVPIVNGVLSASGSVVAPLATGGSSAACSPVTDVPNPNTAGGPSERVFMSVQGNGLPSPCASINGGCVISIVDAPWTPATNYVVGQQVLSLNMHIETATTAGESALLAGNHPTWSNQIAQTVSDGAVATQVIWIDQGAFTSPFVTWLASNTYVTPLVKILDTNGNVQALTTTGTTGGSQPLWNPTPGLTTTDGSAIWTNVGAIGTAALPMPGGTSGIIVDNILGPATVVGGSQIYFTTLSDQTVCGFTAGPGGCAVQASQVALK